MPAPPLRAQPADTTAPPRIRQPLTQLLRGCYLPETPPAAAVPQRPHPIGTTGMDAPSEAQNAASQAAGAVPATLAGSWDGAMLGAANTTQLPSQWKCRYCRSCRVFPAGRLGPGPVSAAARHLP